MTYIEEWTNIKIILMLRINSNCNQNVNGYINLLGCKWIISKFGFNINGIEFNE